MKHYLAILTIILGCVLGAQANQGNFTSLVLGNTGRPIAGATVTFCNHHSDAPNPCTDTAGVILYSDVEGANPIANPTKTDGYGNIFVFMASGTYDYSISGNGVVTTTYKGIQPSTSGGSVTSVAMTGDNVVYNTTITGSPITGSGTLVPVPKTQSAWTMFGNNSASSTPWSSFSINPLVLPGGLNINNSQLFMSGFIATIDATPFTNNSGNRALRLVGTGSFTDFINFHSNSSSADADILFSANNLSLNVANGTGIWITSNTGVEYQGPTNAHLKMPNIEWESGLLTHYGTTSINSATTGNGQAVERAQIDATGQGAAITTAVLYSVPTDLSTLHRLQWSAKVTTVDGSSSTLGAMTITYVDPDNITQTIVAPATTAAGAIATTSAGNSTATVLIGMPLLLNCKVSTDITYAFAYASNTPGQMKYNLHIVLEGL